MPKAYWIAAYRQVRDPDALAAYARLAAPAIRNAGGRNLVRGMPARTLEDGVNARTVVIEFDRGAAARAAYDSPAYKEARQLLGDTVERDIRIVEAPE